MTPSEHLQHPDLRKQPQMTEPVVKKREQLTCPGKPQTPVPETPQRSASATPAAAAYSPSTPQRPPPTSCTISRSSWLQDCGRRWWWRWRWRWRRAVAAVVVVAAAAAVVVWRRRRWRRGGGVVVAAVGGASGAANSRESSQNSRSKAAVAATSMAVCPGAVRAKCVRMTTGATIWQKTFRTSKISNRLK